MSATVKGWIGVDLDGTLAAYDGWKGEEHIGPPVPRMLERVRRWVEQGRTVKIFTARVCEEESGGPVTAAIQSWCVRHLGYTLEVTCRKDYQMIELWDDRCVQVVPNTGRSLAEEHEAQRAARSGGP